MELAKCSEKSYAVSEPAGPCCQKELVAMARRRYQRPEVRRVGTGGNERWVIRYREDVLNGSGRRVRVCRKTTIGRCSKLTKAMAQRAADELLSKGANSATFQPTTTITFSEFVGEKYLKMAMPNRKRAGRLTATSHLEHHLIPWFGEMPLAGINQEAVQQMATALLKSGLSLSTVRGVCA